MVITTHIGLKFTFALFLSKESSKQRNWVKYNNSENSLHEKYLILFSTLKQFQQLPEPENPDMEKRIATRCEKLGKVGGWREVRDQREGTRMIPLGSSCPD